MGLGGKIALGCGGLAVLLLLVLGLGMMGSYNGLNSLSQAVDAQWDRWRTSISGGRTWSRTCGNREGRRRLRKGHLHGRHRSPGQGGPGVFGRQGPGLPGSHGQFPEGPGGAWARRCPGCWWWWKNTPSSRPPRISGTCRPSWRAPRTASRWSECASTRRPRPSTPSATASRRCWSRGSSATASTNGPTSRPSPGPTRP